VASAGPALAIQATLLRQDPARRLEALSTGDRRLDMDAVPVVTDADVQGRCGRSPTEQAPPADRTIDPPVTYDLPAVRLVDAALLALLCRTNGQRYQSAGMSTAVIRTAFRSVRVVRKSRSLRAVAVCAQLSLSAMPLRSFRVGGPARGDCRHSRGQRIAGLGLRVSGTASRSLSVRCHRSREPDVECLRHSTS
jgi:hypothetical protein